MTQPSHCMWQITHHISSQMLPFGNLKARGVQKSYCITHHILHTTHQTSQTVLEGCYRDLREVLQGFYRNNWGCYRSVTGMLQGYKKVTAKDELSSTLVQFILIFCKPGQSQGLLYKHRCARYSKIWRREDALLSYFYAIWQSFDNLPFFW